MAFDPVAGTQARARPARTRPVWWIACGFIAVQAGILWAAPAGPFVDEGLYTVAGLRVLDGHGLSDGYVTWFNGSPFVWPVLAAAGHHVAGLAGARLMAVALSTITLLAVSAAAGRLFGQQVSGWCALAFALNGLFAALAHFAVYDVAALTGLAVAIWCVSRSGAADHGWWMAGAAAAFALAVVAKYGYMAMAVPLVALVACVRPGAAAAARSIALLVAVAGALVAAYFLLCFGTVMPSSADAYLEQSFGRTRGHIAALQVVFGAVPLALAIAGALAVRRQPRGPALAAVSLLALFVYPMFHLWTGNFVSGQKHAVAGFLFAYPIAGAALERLWRSRSRAWTIAVIAALALWGGVQCYWQDRSWPDVRPLAAHLVANVRPGDRVLAESPWSYTLFLYPAGRVVSPWDVIDANHARDRERLDLCRIAWVVGDPDSAPTVARALRQCGHERVRSLPIRQYYLDTSRLRLATSSAVVSLYRLPPR